MEKFKQFINENKWVRLLKEVLASPYLIAFTALFYLIMNYIGGDLATIYYVGIIGSLMILLLDDVTPVVTQIPFMHLIVSNVNAPSEIKITLGGQEYLMRGATELYSDVGFLVQVGLVIGLYVIAFCTRLVLTAKRKKLKITPVTVMLFALASAFLFNGVGAPGYKINHLAYGVIMAFFFVVIFMTVSSNVKVNRQNLTFIAYGFIGLSALLAVELLIAYLSAPIIIYEGAIVKEAICFGWGVWNTIGMLLTMCIPFAFYLATTRKRGYLWFLYACFLLIAAFAAMSRQGMIGSALAFAASWVIMLIRVKEKRARKINLIISGVMILAAIIVVAVWHGKIFALFGTAGENLTDESGAFTGNGRMDLIEQAFKNFLKGPVFGAGFFAEVHVSSEFVGVGAIPCMYHNTIAELLGACGLCGLFTYLVYRAFTVYGFVKTASWEKSFVAISVAGLLLLSLVDNHIFYIYPTFSYSALMAFVLGEDETKPEKEEGEPEKEESELEKAE